MKSRNGQWWKFHPRDTALPAQLTAAGAFQTPDGFFLAIYVPEGKDALGEPHPEKLMAVDRAGDNVQAAVRNLQGQLELQNISFHPDQVQDLTPLLDLAHLPPGYRPAEGWAPRP